MSSTITNKNVFEDLPIEDLPIEDGPSSNPSQMHNDTKAPKRSRRQPAKAAKAKATGIMATDVTSRTSKKEIDTTKPQWQLELSLTDLEAHKAAENIRKHHEKFPPKSHPNATSSNASHGNNAKGKAIKGKNTIHSQYAVSNSQATQVSQITQPVETLDIEPPLPPC